MMGRVDYQFKKYYQMGPVFSVITPTYKSSRYIEDLMTCMQGQTYKQWEWLIVPDDGDENIKNLVNRDERIRILWRPRQMTGRADTRNHGLINATGTHIVYLDHDDLLDHEYLKKCAAHYLSSNKLAITPTHIVEYDTDEYIAKIGDSLIGLPFSISEYSHILASLHVIGSKSIMPLEVNSFCDDVIRDAKLLHHHGPAMMLDTYYVLRTHDQQITQNVIETDVRCQYKMHLSEFSTCPQLADVFMRRLAANKEFDKSGSNDWYAYWTSQGIWR